MMNFDFTTPAEVFVLPFRPNIQTAMIYRRFETGAEAIQFAMEDQDAGALRGTSVETDDVRLEADDIRTLYASPAYPLVRTSR